MRLGSIGYLTRLGWKNMASNRLMTFASVGVLTACLIITGVASLLSVNVNRVVQYIGEQNEIIAYVEDEVDTARIEEMQKEIEGMANVASVAFVSKDDAFKELQEMMDDKADLLAGYEQLLPASFRVTVTDLQYIDETGAKLREMENIDSADIPTDMAGVMVSIKNAVNYAGWALVVVLGLVSVIVISNTIRLTVFARRREISIMKYVGATNAFIRLPFFVEGLTVGTVAGLLATGVVCGAYYGVLQFIGGSVNLWMGEVMRSLLPLADVWALVLVGFVAFGMAIGGLGTAFSVRKHLKV